MDLVTILTSLIGGGIAGFGTFLIQERRLRKTYQLEDRAEDVVRQLLSVEGYPQWSFKVIRHHLGGFEAAELRKILVRTGAIRFKAKNGEEVWGLLERNQDYLGVPRIDREPENLRDEDLFDVSPD